MDAIRRVVLPGGLAELEGGVVLAAVAACFLRPCAAAFDERVQVGGLVLLVAHGSSLINDVTRSSPGEVGGGANMDRRISHTAFCPPSRRDSGCALV